jgi:hypothetical protein
MDRESPTNVPKLCGHLVQHAKKDSSMQLQFLTFVHPCRYVTSRADIWIRVQTTKQLKFKFVPFEVSSPYGSWVWRLEFEPAQFIPVTLFTLPLCPALPEGQGLVVFWPLVCSLMNRDGLNSLSSSFSKSFWRLPKTGPGVSVLVSWRYCIFCWVEGCVMFS